MGDLADTDYRRTLDRYALYGEIAAGGMATVHFGRVLGAQAVPRVVAIKRLLPELAVDPAFVRMFLAEGRLASRIRHPNVVATHDVVALPGASDAGAAGTGELFHVMEYVAGDSLARLVRKARQGGTQVPPRIAVSIACGLLEGLHAAHEAKSETGAALGLVHRDVSPQNVMVGVDGMARVLDFGIATATHMVEEAPDQLRGKVGYMAPEQLAHEPVDRRTDVYAAAVVLWEALTGRRLFKADHISTLIVKVMADPVEVPSTFAQGIPSDLDMVIMKGLSRDVRDRWSSARELAVLLEQALPPAPAREVGAWVEAIGGERIQYRGAVVAAIESQSIAHLKIPSASRNLGVTTTLADARAELGAMNENALPSAVEAALVSDPQIQEILRRRSQPLLMESEAGPISAPPPVVAPVAVPAVALAPAPTSAPTPAPTSAPTSAAPPSRPPLGRGARSALLGLGVVGLIGAAAYAGLTLGDIEPPPRSVAPDAASAPVSAAPSAAPTPPEESIGIGSPDAATRGADAAAHAGANAGANDCAVPYVTDARGVRRMKPRCVRR